MYSQRFSDLIIKISHKNGIEIIYFSFVIELLEELGKQVLYIRYNRLIIF